MPEIEESLLPGVGVRHEFTTTNGERVSVITHRTGRREIAVYDTDDPDLCRSMLHLSVEDTLALAELLGTSHVSEAVRTAQRLEGLAIDWVTVPEQSPFANATIADGEFRTKTGASIVAIIRDEATTIAAPGPDTRFAPGDVVVAIGTPEGLQRLRTLFGS
jgi:TrkA domain protein